jgi:GAF domain-containing protein
MKKNVDGAHPLKGMNPSGNLPVTPPVVKTLKKTQEALPLRRDELIYQVMSFAAEKFLVAQTWEESIAPFLARLGEVTRAGRVALFKNCAGQNGRLQITRHHEWLRGGLSLSNVPAQPVVLPPEGFLKDLDRGLTCQGEVSALSQEAQQLFSTRPNGSYLLLPVFVRNSWWGFLGFEDPLPRREWPEAERTVLEAGANILGSAIERDQVGKVLNSTVQISEVAHFAQNLDQLYRMIHQIISELMPAENFYIALYDEDSQIDKLSVFPGRVR